MISIERSINLKSRLIEQKSSLHLYPTEKFGFNPSPYCRSFYENFLLGKSFTETRFEPETRSYKNFSEVFHINQKFAGSNPGAGKFFTAKSPSNNFLSTSSIIVYMIVMHVSPIHSFIHWRCNLKFN